MKAPLITFEGIDGSGKSLQAERLAARLKEMGIPYRLLRDPGGTEVSEAVRRILLDHSHASMTSMTELLLYESARAQLVEEAIRPALERGEPVICDRFTDSTLAYQGFGRGLDLDLIRQANRMACGGIKPSRTYVLDIPVEESLRRKAGMQKSADRMETQAKAFFERVRQGYLNIAKKEPERVLVLDGGKSVSELEQEILADVKILFARFDHSKGK